MSISRVQFTPNTGSNVGGALTSISVTPTNPTINGNLCVLQISWDADPGTITAPTGFTVVNAGKIGLAPYCAQYLYPNAPSLSIAQTFSWTNGVTCSIVHFIEYSGAATSSPEAASAGSNTGTNNSITDTVTPTISNQCLVGICCQNNTLSTTFTNAGSFNQISFQSVSAGLVRLVQSFDELNSGVTGGTPYTDTQTSNHNNAWTATSIAIKLAGSVVTGDGSSIGVTTVSGTGKAIDLGVGSATGVATVFGSSGTSDGAGAATGVTTVAGIGLLTTNAVGASTGSASVSGTIRNFRLGIGSSVGKATCNAVPVGIGQGTILGVATVLATSRLALRFTGSSIGLATVLGQSFQPGAGYATSTGSATVLATGIAFSLGAVNSTGSATASANIIGSPLAGIGQSTGLGTVLGTGKALGNGVGSSTGIASVAANGFTVTAGVGSSTGSATASAHALVIASAIGQAIVTGIMNHIQADVGSASGKAIVTGYGNYFPIGTIPITLIRVNLLTVTHIFADIK